MSHPRYGVYPVTRKPRAPACRQAGEPVDEWRQVAKRVDKSHGRKAVVTGFTKYAENDIEEIR